jgi:hypothetical protein
VHVTCGSMNYSEWLHLRGMCFFRETHGFHPLPAVSSRRESPNIMASHYCIRSRSHTAPPGTIPAAKSCHYHMYGLQPCYLLAPWISHREQAPDRSEPILFVNDGEDVVFERKVNILLWTHATVQCTKVVTQCPFTN